MTTENKNPQRHVLLVDDDDEFRQIVKETAEGLGLKISEARNGYEGLELAKKELVDAIVSDINMPVMDGLRFLSEVRAAELQTPFIILTGYGDKESAVTALRYGAFSFLEKPFEEEDLAKTLQAAVEYGAQLKLLDSELEEAYKKALISPARIEEFRRAKKAVLLLKKQRLLG